MNDLAFENKQKSRISSSTAVKLSHLIATIFSFNTGWTGAADIYK